MSTESSYYVPEQSKLPIITATGMGLMAYGAASWVVSGGSMIFTAGLAIMAVVMFKWWMRRSAYLTILLPTLLLLTTPSSGLATKPSGRR